MRKLKYASIGANVVKRNRILLVLLLAFAITSSSWSQCNSTPNTIGGSIFEDLSFDGVFDNSESGLEGIAVIAYDNEGDVAGSGTSNQYGQYSIGSLTDGEVYRLEFGSNSTHTPGFEGVDSRSSVQFVTAPVCDASYSMTPIDPGCVTNPNLVITCFVQGTSTSNQNVETLVSVPHEFDVDSDVEVYATHGQTGSIWGLTHHPTTNTLFTSAFVKQYSGLKYSPYSILRTSVDSKLTAEFVNVSDLLPNSHAVSGLSVTDPQNCDYGNQVGRVGLGGLILVPKAQRLYTAVLDNNTVVSIPINSPTTDNIQVFDIPRPTGIPVEEEFKIFALEWHDDVIYVGGTITGSHAKNKNSSEAVVMTLDPITGDVNTIFRTTYIKGFWQDAQPSLKTSSHWFTDIDFADSGEMIISLSDRIGHRYCKNPVNRLDQQYPDLLMVGYNQSTGQWELESNGIVNGKSGSGVGNDDGPGGGEFFGFDFWPDNADYHNETALGSSYVLPGTGSVVAAVYDPINAYSAGLHRYSTEDGSLLGVKELYTGSTNPQFGKATGFGDIIAICAGKQPVEIGNLVWVDENGNGMQDAGEEGLGNVTLNLFDSDCNEIGTTTTNDSGNYTFNNANVAQGLNAYNTYFIQIANNYYEVATGVYTVNGEDYSICVPNLGEASNDDIDCDAGFGDNDCFESPYIELSPSNTNHTFDIGFGEAIGMDLALIKQLEGETFAILGEDLTFKITVVNQGGSVANRTKVVDYVPNGYTFDQNKNPNWEIEGGVIYTWIEDDIRPGESFPVYITLDVNQVVDFSDYTNTAEIAQVEDLAGNIADDNDSTADDQNDDPGGVPFSPSDDQTDGEGTVDEDDHDSEQPGVFDLAVKIELADNKYYCRNDIVKFDVTLYNQGEVDADFVRLNNYFPSQLKFRGDLSDGWIEEQGKIYYNEINTLTAGNQNEYAIYFEVENDVDLQTLVHFIEISHSSPVGDARSFDYDSSPDDIENNDIGGEPFTYSDNLVTDHGGIDEDDHDPVTVNVRFVDLALMMTVENEQVEHGEIVEYCIEVTNQGNAPVYGFDLVNYIPKFLYLADDTWEQVGEMAFKTYKLDDPLYENESFKTYIKLKVDDTAESQEIINVAEIKEVYGSSDVKIGDKDIDSKPDILIGNDPGGIAGSNTDNTINSDKDIDEDDHDPARIILLAQASGLSVCMHNATTSTNGQFVDIIAIFSGTNEDWEVIYQEGYYENIPANDPPANPSEIALGTEMTEINLFFFSTYGISARRIHGEAGFIVFSNGIENDTFERAADFYDELILIGSSAVCLGNTEVYSVINPDPDVTYEFSVSGGTPFTQVDDSSISIDWTTGVGEYEVSVEVVLDNPLNPFEPGRCTAPATRAVKVVDKVGTMSCYGNVNVSLDADCSFEVTPEMILSVPPSSDAAYEVVLTTNTGEVIPNAVLTADHEGTVVMASIIDACGGNSCWGTVTVEDKFDPVINCKDMFVNCTTDLMSLPDPKAYDNCNGPVTVDRLWYDLTTLDCDSNYSAIFVEAFQATDEQGNQSIVCERETYVERIIFENIVFPDSLLFVNNDALPCGQYPTIGNTDYPTLAYTGFPTYLGQNLIDDFGNNFILCNAAGAFSDGPIQNFGHKRRFVRTFTIYEWFCDGTRTITYNQVIYLADNTPPEITCVDLQNQTADANTCVATFILPFPIAEDACGDVVSVVVNSAPTGIIDITSEDPADRQVTLPVGIYDFEYTATDGAGNPSTCGIQIEVVPGAIPAFTCQAANIGLKDDGTAFAYPFSFINPGQTFCGDPTYEVKKSTDIEYGEYVAFDCSESGDTILIDVKITINGVSNTCQTNAFIQDKNAPEIDGPDDITLDCTVDLSTYAFLPFIPSDECTMDTVVNDFVTDSLSACGIGIAYRIFGVRDSFATTIDTQYITIENMNPLMVSDVECPAPWTTNGDFCDVQDLFDNANAGMPFVKSTFTGCFMMNNLSSDTSDVEYFALQDGSCKALVNITWTFEDGCNNDQLFICNQPLYVVIEDTDFDIIDPADITEVVDDCGTSAIIQDTVVACPGNYNWIVNITDDQNTLISTTTGNGESAILDYAFNLGTFDVEYIFENQCGKADTAQQIITVIPDTEVNIVCKSDTTLYLDAAGDVCILAEELILSTNDCIGDITYSFEENSVVPELCYTCGDGPVSVTVYAFETADPSNSGFCSPTTITIIDTIPPVLTFCPNDITIEEAIPTSTDCDFDITDTSFDATATDACGDLLTNDYNLSSTLLGDNFPLVDTSFTITWSFDGEDYCEQNVTISPFYECPPNITDSKELNSGNNFMVTFNSIDLVDLSNNCGFDYTVTPPSFSYDCNSIGTHVETITVSAPGIDPVDCEVTLIVTQEDPGDPVLVCAPSATVDLSSDVITDDCVYTIFNTMFNPTDFDTDLGCVEGLFPVYSIDQDVVIPANTMSEIIGEELTIGIHTIHWHLIDANGVEYADCSLNVTVNDDVAPECPDNPATINITLSGDTILNADVLPIGLFDDCSLPITYTFDPAVLTCDMSGPITVNIIATDDAGNPSLVCPIPFNINVDPDSFECPNNASASMTINEANSYTVTFDVDQILDLEGDCGITYTVDPPSFTYDCESLDGSISETFVETVTVSAPGVADAVCEISLTVTQENPNDPPLLECVGDMTVELSFADGDINDCFYTIGDFSFNPISFDIAYGCATGLFPVYSINQTTIDLNNVETAIVGEQLNLGLNTITWYLVDANGTSYTDCTINITVNDDVAPECPDPTPTIQITLSGDTTLTEDVIPLGMFDDCSGPLSFTFQPATLSCSDDSPVSVIVTATDAAGNPSLGCPILFEITVPPSDIMCSLNVDTLYLDITGADTINLSTVVITGQTCDEEIDTTLSKTTFICNEISNNPIDISIFANGELCGVDSVVLVDTFPPELTCNLDMTISCTEFENTYDGDTSVLLNQIPAFTFVDDNCSINNIETVTTSDINDCFYGTITRVVTVSDEFSGQTTTCTHEIEISGPQNELTQLEVDGILPVTVTQIGCPDDMIDPAIDTISIADLEGLTDCGQFEVSFADTLTSDPNVCPAVYERTYTINAVCQEEVFTFVQTIFITDNLPPTITEIADMTIALANETCDSILNLAALFEASDMCSLADTTYMLDGVLLGSELLDLEPGEFEVQINVLDACMNSAGEIFNLVVTDSLFVVCTKLVVEVDPSMPDVEINSNEFLTASTGCMDSIEFLFTYSLDNFADTLATFPCGEEPTKTTIFIYTEDADGIVTLFDSCETALECNFTTTILGVSGEIATEYGEGIPNYSLTMHGSGLDPEYSDGDGEYAFPIMPTGGAYTISTYNNDDVMNGVSTLDLIFIQRHILEIELLDSPYKIIAADINNSETLSSSDLLQLRKMILGVYSEFPNNMSWRTVDANFEFHDPTDPFADDIPTGYEINTLTNDMVIDFVGLKVGDVNNTAILNYKDEKGEVRGEGETLFIEDSKEIGVLQIAAESSMDVTGMQFNLYLSEGEIMNINSAYFGDHEISFNEISDRLYNIVIAGSYPERIEENAAILEIETTAKAENISISSKGLQAEMYLNESLDIMPFKIAVRDLEDFNGGFTVHQNSPNPWSGYTSIEINNMEASEVMITVFDVAGRTVYSSNQYLTEGSHKIEFDDSKVPGSGVFYYEISSGKDRVQYKMIKLR